jgi:hypothetical protein
MQSPISLATRVRRNPDLVATEMDGDLVMLHVERGQYFGVGQVGRRIWEMLDALHDVAALCADVEARFDVDAARCNADLLEFVADLLDKDVLRPA